MALKNIMEYNSLMLKLNKQKDPLQVLPDIVRTQELSKKRIAHLLPAQTVVMCMD